jgi:hypothetical protein
MVLSSDNTSVLTCISAYWGPSDRRWRRAEGGILYRDHSTYFIHLSGERDASDNVRKASLHFAAEGLTTLHWSRLSDRIGRKPVLLSCLAGTIVSMFLFGLSRSFWAILLRCTLHSLSLSGYVIR